MAQTYTLTCTPEAAAERICAAIEGGTVTGELIDRYSIGEGGRICIVLVFEKYTSRTGGRLTLTVTLDNLDGVTRVHLAGSGGGRGMLFGFDWGAADSFEQCAIRALADVMQ